MLLDEFTLNGQTFAKRWLVCMNKLPVFPQNKLAAANLKRCAAYNRLDWLG